MLESRVEDALTMAAHRAGGRALKWVSPGKPGVPDRIVLLPVPPEHQEIVARYVKFREVKAPGKKPRPLQVKWLQILTGLGFDAAVVDSKEAARAIAG